MLTASNQPAAADAASTARVIDDQETNGSALDRTPRLGWIDMPSPVTDLARMAAQLGLDSLHVKRDDLLSRLGGGTKVRKLDHLFACAPFVEAPVIATVGAIGSGHLVACARAAALRGQRIEAHLFGEELSAGVLDNLAITASGPGDLLWHPNRAHLLLYAARFVMTRPDRVARTAAGYPILPPGGTLPLGMRGLVRAGFELAAQVRAGLLPMPDIVYVTLGSAGTAVGLALGLGAAGLRCQVRAVAAVERWLAGPARLRDLERALRADLRAAGLASLADAPSVPIVCDFRQVGPGYGVATAAAVAAMAALSPHGLALEPVYTGKTMAALLADADAARLRGKGLGHVVFWSTVRTRRHAEPDVDPRWRERLPLRLRTWLAGREQASRDGPRRLPGPAPRWTGAPELEVAVSRRAAIAGGLAVVGGLATLVRSATGPELAGWTGTQLSAREAAVVAATAEALLPPAPPPDAGMGLAAWLSVAMGADRCVAGLPRRLRRLTRLGLFALEQATCGGGHWLTLAELAPAERRAELDRLARGGPAAAALYDLGRELATWGYYADRRSWAALGFTEPSMPEVARARRTEYAALVAAAATLPRSASR